MIPGPGGSLFGAGDPGLPVRSLGSLAWGGRRELGGLEAGGEARLGAGAGRRRGPRGTPHLGFEGGEGDKK